jgi:hypothetical protein
MRIDISRSSALKIASAIGLAVLQAAIATPSVANQYRILHYHHQHHGLDRDCEHAAFPQCGQ